MIFVISGYEILQDRPRFEDVDLLAVGESVHDGGDTAIWVDLQEPGLFLCVLGELNFMHFIREAKCMLEQWDELEVK